MGIKLICAQSLHVGLCFAALRFLLLYKQYPTALLSTLLEGMLAFHLRVTLWCPVSDDGCNVGTPAGGHRRGLGSAEAKRGASAWDIFVAG
jgi:hypothetical protein